MKYFVTAKKANNVSVTLTVEVNPMDFVEYGKSYAIANAVHKMLFPDDPSPRISSHIVKEIIQIAESITVEDWYPGPRIKGSKDVKRM